MTIDEILDEMDNILLEATAVPFTDKKIVEENEFIRLMDELRDRLPVELADAKRLIGDRQRILEDAQREAALIVEQAKLHGNRLTEESVITKQAQEQAHEVLAEAQRNARELQNDAMAYAEDVFRHLETNLNRALEVVQQGKNDLRTPKK